RQEFRGMPVGEEAQVLTDDAAKHPALIFGDDAIADLRELHGAEISGARLHHEDDGGEDADEDDAAEVLVNVGLVDHVADQIGAVGCRGGCERHEQKGVHVAWPLACRLLDHEPPDQCERAGVLGGREVGFRSGHSLWPEASTTYAYAVAYAVGRLTI